MAKVGNCEAILLFYCFIGSCFRGVSGELDGQRTVAFAAKPLMSNEASVEK